MARRREGIFENIQRLYNGDGVSYIAQCILAGLEWDFYLLTNPDFFGGIFCNTFKQVFTVEDGGSMFVAHSRGWQLWVLGFDKRYCLLASVLYVWPLRDLLGTVLQSNVVLHYCRLQWRNLQNHGILLSISLTVPSYLLPTYVAFRTNCTSS